jgi:hypothetical protein
VTAETAQKKHNKLFIEHCLLCKYLYYTYEDSFNSFTDITETLTEEELESLGLVGGELKMEDMRVRGKSDGKTNYPSRLAMSDGDDDLDKQFGASALHVSGKMRK